MFIRMEESLLAQIIRILLIFGHPQNSLENLLLMPTGQLCKSIHISFPRMRHKLIIRQSFHFIFPYH